jgi:hypothetical protein
MHHKNNVLWQPFEAEAHLHNTGIPHLALLIGSRKTEH